MLRLKAMNLHNEGVDVGDSPQHRPSRVGNSIQSAAVDGAARIFRALGDGPRLRLLAHLLDGERCVGDLAELEGEALSTISQRLRVLRTEKIIVRRRQGKHVNYCLADRHIVALVRNAMAYADEPASGKSEPDRNYGKQQDQSNS
jgi:ArsR family transcriptional regulator, lead/cadmium/zinc/bismuth-responsive transcriptional repressor